MSAALTLADRMTDLGTETAFEVLARAEQLSREGRDIINLGIGQPDFKTPPNIVAAGNQALLDGHHGYTPAIGVPALREAVAADIGRRRGVSVDPDRILIVPGGKPTMFFSCLRFGEVGAEIMYPNPGFPIYESAIRFSGATPVPIPLYEETGFPFDPHEVLDRITPNTRLIIVNSPANPTGGVLSKDGLDTLVSGLAAHPHVCILSDEIYSRMVYDNQPHVSLLAYEEIRDRLILLDGWSKTYAMTGWRLGYSLWPGPLIDLAVKLCVNDHSCVNAATQYAGIEALTGPQDAVDEMMRAFDERRRVIVDKLNNIPGVRCVMPGGAFYAFANIIGTGATAQDLQKRLLEEAGVAAVAGTSFGEYGEGFIRFSYANSIENIREAMCRFRGLLAS
ncbi:MAG: pyridoxal phosphate-dependent aminotransferase [Rhodospirillaceae bacterium]|nr:pyridoxal phosphate-dependent aminotransferase [Rhodospirillaceae bacterium]